MPKRKKKRTSQEQRIITIVDKHGINAFRRWGKSAWTPRTRKRGRVIR